MGYLLADYWSQVPAKGMVVLEAARIDGAETHEREVLVGRLDLAGLSPTSRPAQPLAGAIGSGLFRTFAALSDDAIATFASRYGWLGVPMVAAELADGRELVGEPVSRWQAERDRMATSITIWDALRLGQPPCVYGGVYDAEAHALKPFDWEHLGHAFDTAESAGHLRTAHVTLRPGNDRPLSLQLVSDTLLAALWLQFAQAIHGNKDYRACGACGRFFELDPAVARTNRLYCSDACRSKAYRTRKGN
jgi:hypothetical protein